MKPFGFSNRLRIGADINSTDSELAPNSISDRGRGVLAMSDKLAHDALEMVDYRENPAVHVFGDSEPALERMRRTAQAAGLPHRLDRR